MPFDYNALKSALPHILNRIHGAIYTPIGELSVKAWITPEPVSYDDRFSGREETIAIGQKWGNIWDCAWFHFTGSVPSDGKGRKVVLLIDVNGEACVVDKDGNPVQGLTNVNSTFDYSLGRPGKRVVDVADPALGGEIVDIWADAGCNDLFGTYKGNGTLKDAHIAICNEEMRKLFYDFEVLLELMQQLPQDSARHHSILRTLGKAARALVSYDEAEAATAREILAPELAKTGGDPSLKVSAIGHAHIDLAWLWPIRETIRKGARTFATALYMMDKYPDYVFGGSQPQLYQWIKDRYPTLYGRVKQRIAEGRWEAQGGMWVEADTNVSGGEALVRQLLYGKRYFKKEFGVEPKTAWLPDVFGYTGALPQILKKSGTPYFCTIKLSWNTTNTHPHHTFTWKGIDGSDVLVHMPPEGTYNSSAAPRAIAKSEKNYLDKGVSDECLMVFGIGDGGGGPGEEHLERLQREGNLAGLAPVAQESSTAFFDRLAMKASEYSTWVGELYLEKHQGTYTTQARNKRFNRKLELMLREAEYAAVLAEKVAGIEYPRQDIEEIWKEVLLYQFHDILPGSSITRVYDESIARYAQLKEKLKAIIDKSHRAWLASADTGGKEQPVVIVNSLPWERKEWVSYGGKWFNVQVPPMGYSVIDAAQDFSAPITPNGNHTLENEKLKVTFNADGRISSIFDKEFRREVIPEGSAANTLDIYKDDGDAWDFNVLYDQQAPESFVLKSVEPRVEGPRTILKQVYEYGQSTLTQEVVLTSGSRRLDFITKVDWKESGRMLRTAFPVNVTSTKAVCDIQFGSIERPTHGNTTWDSSKFEICAHKWIDISQRDYGVALLNDCKYGHRAFGNVLDINLLRSPSYPDSRADRACHEFTYSLYPHGGDHVEGDVAAEGYKLNVPLSLYGLEGSGHTLPSGGSFVKASHGNIVIESVKKSEDSGDMVIRLYENAGKGVRTKLDFMAPVKSAKLVNLMEDDTDQSKFDGNSMVLEFGPFEIHSLKISM